MILAAQRARGQIAMGVAIGLSVAAIATVSGWAVKVALCAILLAIPALWWMLREPGRWLILFFVSALLLPPFPVDLGDAGPHVARLCLPVLISIFSFRRQADTDLSSSGSTREYSGARRGFSTRRVRWVICVRSFW